MFRFFYLNRVPTLCGYVSRSKYSPTDGEGTSSLLEKTKDVVFINAENIDNLITAAEILDLNLKSMQIDVEKRMTAIEKGLKSQLSKKKEQLKRKR